LGGRHIGSPGETKSDHQDKEALPQRGSVDIEEPLVFRNKIGRQSQTRRGLAAAHIKKPIFAVLLERGSDKRLHVG